MENVCIFEPRDQYYQCRSVYSNISCLDNPVWQAHSLRNGTGIGLAATEPGLFISQNARPHHATSRNHPALTAANTTHTFSAPRPHPKQDGPASFQDGIRVSPANGAPETSNRNDGTGQLPASITFAAIPPAAFFHTTFFNLACPG